VTIGKIHEYLGMKLDFSEGSKYKINMDDYIEEMLEELSSDMDGEAVTPAASHLFDVKEDGIELSKEQAQMFHHNTAKLLFLSKQARPDIQTAVAFLSTRVKAPDNDDYRKLARTMKYLHATMGLSVVLETDDITVIKWWVDGSYATHPDMRSHTGGTMSLGKGFIYVLNFRVCSQVVNHPNYAIYPFPCWII
jgi:hypothetical protein